MRVVSSFGNQKYRSRDCQVVKRHRRMYLRSKLRPRFKLRQGRARMKKNKS
uniref:Large ribosomal subunit protein bL36c n=1 Tax=Karlodinium veneficum TaxID=407301 RepID=G1E799_KARVE|nr:ribosomal protein L36 [Karlodinium veneficum]